MRRILISVALATGSASPAAAHPAAVPADAGPRYVTVASDALDAARRVAARHGGALHVLEATRDAALVTLADADLGLLAEQIHAELDRCGGFMVHDSASDARAALTDADAARPERPGLDYTLDRPELVRAILPAVDAARIHGTIRELSAMQNRYYQSPTGAAASRWLRERWRSFTSRPDVTVDLYSHGYAQQSVILTIPGTTRRDEVIVIGGHLDSIAIGGSSGNAPGADDDASGIATLTEVARALLAADYRPARTIQFMAYAAEEVGLRGSLQIARDYQRKGIDVVGALQLDMTNYRGSDKDIWLMKDFTSAAQNSFLARLIDTYVGATWGIDACGYACSDHAAWNRTGVPASMPFEARMRDANRTIHTRKDTLETSGDNAEHAVKFARLAAAYAIELGKGELASPPAAALSAPAVASAPADFDGTTRTGGLHLLATASLLLLLAAWWFTRLVLGRDT